MNGVSSLFPAAASCVYLNTASMALGNGRATEALEAATEEWRDGSFVWEAAEAVGEELRGQVARLLRVGSEDVALVGGAAGGAATVAAQLPGAKTAGNVVVPARDFASNFLPWLLLRERGYEIRLVEDTDGVLPIDAFARQVDLRTRVVATSLVQSATGFRVDLDGLKTLTADAGAWLVLDASQALGGIDIAIEGIDALFSCSHKWLLGIRGIGHLYVHPELRDRFIPITPG